MHPSIATLTFGIELEVIFPGSYSRAAAAGTLSRLSGIAVADRATTVPSWKLVSDGSISGRGLGLEVVSPVLVGDEGLEQCAKIANALVSMGATVNQSTGFHVHVGARGKDLAFFKNLVKLYAKFEEAIDTIMPASRRGNVNGYCRSVRIGDAPIEQAATLGQLQAAFGTRYRKLNLHAFERHNTVEFRQHSGTVDAVKITNWVQVCLKLVAAAAAGKTGDAVSMARDFSTLEAKCRLVAEFITRPEGATAEEIRAAGNFKALSVTRQARLAGLTVTERKVRGQPLRFFGAASGETVAVPATIEGLAELIEADQSIRDFLNRRRAAVRG